MRSHGYARACVASIVAAQNRYFFPARLPLCRLITPGRQSPLTHRCPEVDCSGTGQKRRQISSARLWRMHRPTRCDVTGWSKAAHGNARVSCRARWPARFWRKSQRGCAAAASLALWKTDRVIDDYVLSSSLKSSAVRARSILRKYSRHRGS
jgi:hypothetical protein